MITDEDMALALDRIARSADGELLYLWLTKRLMGVIPPGSDSALNHDNGERTFAAKLMGHMAKGIEESGRQSDPSKRPTVFASVERASVAGQSFRGAGRRIADTDTEFAGPSLPPTDRRRAS